MKFHHIGIVCKDIYTQLENIKNIHNIKCISDVVCDDLQKVSLCMVETEEGINMELVSGEKVKNLIKKGIHYYHMCYEVENLQLKLEELSRLGGVLVSKPKPAILFNNRKVAFIQMSYGLIELLEK